MARKNRNLAGFDEVANNNVKTNADDHENVNPNINVGVQENNNDNDNVNVNEKVTTNDNDNANENVNTNGNINTNDNENISPNANANVNLNDNHNVNEPNNDNANADINDNPTPQLDYLDKLIGGDTKKKAENETVLTGIYLQKDLSQLLDRLAKKGGRGAKSRIVNEALRSVFLDKGLL